MLCLVSESLDLREWTARYEYRNDSATKLSGFFISVHSGNLEGNVIGMANSE